MHTRFLLPLAAAGLGLSGVVATTLAITADQAAERPYRAVVPVLSRGERIPTPTATPKPSVYVGPVVSLSLASAGLSGGDPITTAASHFSGGREYLDDPPAPQYIIQYKLPYLAEAPGFAAGHTIFAAHVNYVRYGNGPFANLPETRVDDALYLTMANGTTYTYTVKSVDIISLDILNMDDVVFPPLDSTTERITLISCGGTFIPAAVGGEYSSRVIVVAERYVP